MSNILDYIDWRGDLTLADAPFCEVDNLILTQIAYMDLGGIAYGEKVRESILLCDAVEAFFAKHRDAEPYMGAILPAVLPTLFRKAAASKRFGRMRILRYRDVLDAATETQFAALTVLLGDGSAYVAFRGTDDTLVGWKEDFNMSFLAEIPAQRLAAEYLLETAKAVRTKLRVGGHSKGGNLALYAAAHLPKRLQKRVVGVYNNDGPGFGKDITDSEGYAGIADAVFTVVPRFSVVGLLLEHGKVDAIVQSEGEGIWQHDACTWKVLGGRFVRAEGLDADSLRIEKTLKAWVAELTVEQRRDLVEAVYKAFTANNAQTLTDIAADKLDFLRSLGKMDEKTRDIIVSTGKLLVREGFRTFTEGKGKRKK